MIAEADHVSPNAHQCHDHSDGAVYAWGERLFTPLLLALAAYKDQWDADFSLIENVFS